MKIFGRKAPSIVNISVTLSRKLPRNDLQILSTEHHANVLVDKNRSEYMSTYTYGCRPSMANIYRFSAFFFTLQQTLLTSS